MAGELRFRRSYADPAGGSVPLVFNDSGESGAGFGALDVEVRIGGLAGAELVGVGALAAEVRLGGFAGAELAGLGELAAVVRLTAEGAWDYDVNMWRGPMAQSAADFQHGAPVGRAARLPLSRVDALVRPVALAVAAGEARTPETALAWRRQGSLETHPAVVLGPGERTAVETATPWRATTRIHRDRRAVWRDGASQAISAETPWIQLSTRWTETEAPWRTGQPRARDGRSGSRVGRRLGPETVIPWRQAVRPMGVRPASPVQPPPGFASTNTLLFVGPVLPGNRLIFARLYRHAIPIRRVYLVLHDVSLVRLPDRIPIESVGFTLAWDMDRRDIAFSATVLGAASLDAVLPDSDGMPVVLEAAMDGYVFHVLVEDWDEDRQARKRGIGIKGRSLSARLGAPYVLPTSRTSTQDRTAQQLAAEELPLTGWALGWTAPDWLVPAGAFSVSNQTPIQALQTLAAAAGAIVVPAKAGQALTVQPRYPVLPWNYAGTQPDLVIPESALTHMKRRNAIPTQANTVYLQGGEIGGLLARVLLTGSAGDRLLPMMQDNLLTHVDAARGLGERLLAGQWRQPEVRSVTLPVDGSMFPLMEIGQLAQIDLDSGPVFGIVNGVSLTVAMNKGLSVRQTLTLGEDTPNVWAQFARLLPQDPLLVGTVAAVHGDGTVSVTLVGGGTRRVRGTATAGQSVYIRSGRIDGPAPGLPSYDIEI